VRGYASLPVVTVRPKAIFRRLASDKKTVGGLVHFVLPCEIGRVEIVTDVAERDVLQAVDELCELSRTPFHAPSGAGAGVARGSEAGEESPAR
jgi:hypothetical protein